MAEKNPLRNTKPGLSPGETLVYEALMREGWSVLRSGWPDFLAVGSDRVLAVEVKSPGDGLSPGQRLMHAGLRIAGVDVEVVWVGAERPDDWVFPGLVASLDEAPRLLSWVELDAELEEARGVHVA